MISHGYKKRSITRVIYPISFIFSVPNRTLAHILKNRRPSTMSSTITAPESYTALPFKNISISHVPQSSTTPTKVVLLKLNRPRQFNAVTAEMIEELVTTYQYFEADNRIKAVVVTGSGPAFCAGADLRVGFSRLVDDLKKDTSMIKSYRDGLVL